MDFPWWRTSLFSFVCLCGLQRSVLFNWARLQPQEDKLSLGLRVNSLPEHRSNQEERHQNYQHWEPKTMAVDSRPSSRVTDVVKSTPETGIWRAKYDFLTGPRCRTPGSIDNHSYDQIHSWNCFFSELRKNTDTGSTSNKKACKEYHKW